ncbi:MAG: hypothetical protein LBM70_07250 [Victivallales bacterium]|jgi:Na+/proline symporter|nr:hypothetical protein [Victivallales bacterium]
MGFLPWCIVIVPVLCVIGLAVYSKRYIRGVSDFLVAGRVAGRYVISVCGMESALGVLTLVALVEVNYATGFAITFWQSLLLPLGMFISLTGFCAYRYRETKSLSIGQFLEMRYNRSFRIFATSLRSFAEILCNAIGPAVAARFFIYLLGFPHYIDVFGFSVSTFVLVLIAALLLALIVILSGGQISLIVTDCLQGLMCYPIFVIFTVFILTNFSWFGEVTPTLQAHAPGESFLNPYDIANLRDFNLFALIVVLIARPMSTAVWYGNGTSGAGRTPHEQKMAGILAEWRTGLSIVMCTLVAVAVITVMNHSDFREEAYDIRLQLSSRIAEEIAPDSKVRDAIVESTAKVPLLSANEIDQTILKRIKNFDTPFLDTTLTAMNENMDDSGKANKLFQQYRSLYNQNMLPVALRNILSPAMLGLFALLMIMLMLSTDDSRIFNSAATIVQDIVVPLRKQQFTPEQQVRCLRRMTVVVALIFFLGSIFLAQMDYIQLFVNITTSIWICGAGSVMIFGLYSRFGTTAGAYAALLTGALLSGGGFVVQRIWAETIYPFLHAYNLSEPLGTFLETISNPFNPYIVWTMDPIKFPINSREISFIATIGSLAMYCLFSWITYRQPYNLERMLHRGKYNFDNDDKKIQTKWTPKTVFSKLIGITPDYTRGDKIIAYALFGYTFGYKFVLAFLLVIASTFFVTWQPEWWGKYFFATQVLIPGPIGVITTVWFLIGGIKDLRRLFRDLALRKANALDNGVVEGNVSLADKAAVNAVEKEK